MIYILISILFGFILRDLTINRLKQHTQSASKRIKGNKSSLVAWSPPKKPEEEATDKVIKSLK